MPTTLKTFFGVWVILGLVMVCVGGMRTLFGPEFLGVSLGHWAIVFAIIITGFMLDKPTAT